MEYQRFMASTHNFKRGGQTKRVTDPDNAVYYRIFNETHLEQIPSESRVVSSII